MLELAVVCFPKIQVKEITAFRKEYDLNWRIISSHITLVSPLSNMSEQKLIDHVEHVTNNLGSLPIQLTGIMKTLDGHLFLLVKEGNEKIITLHDALYSGIFSTYLPTDFSFIPHITLGECKTNQNTLLEKAYSEAQNLAINVTTMFDAVSIIRGDGIRPAQIVKTINLHT